ncbi:IclR family transcriptional regulator [Jhaorihella thermophila]|uniref:DNA-binding transcriptional regulator, IclR family n=1 Tax=Jhaorihella thermophila TaxID=488547 RepID=A0A1H5SFE3_9RHOB|nr:IclR family transcriptional regulator [Jhaorihella thermophila]SEF49316.1 DNA-binding transcriptional regulator, IclR family [Jhaorihella thermophila]
MADSEFHKDPDEAKDRNFVTALARGLDVLRCFRANEYELTNTDISERTGLPKATVSRLTHTLCRLEYLIPDARKGTYQLGPGVLRLGFGVLAGMDICDRAGQVLRDLRRGPNSYITAALGERHRTEAIYVAVNRSRENVSLSMHVGSRVPLFFSAMGRAILVAMEQDERDAVFEMAAREDPDRDAAWRESYERAAEEFAARGFCTSYGEWREDVNGIAVPVHSLNRARVYGLNVGGPSFYVSRDELEGEYAEKLMAAANALSLRPG